MVRNIHIHNRPQLKLLPLILIGVWIASNAAEAGQGAVPPPSKDKSKPGFAIESGIKIGDYGVGFGFNTAEDEMPGVKLKAPYTEGTIRTDGHKDIKILDNLSYEAGCTEGSTKCAESYGVPGIYYKEIKHTYTTTTGGRATKDNFDRAKKQDHGPMNRREQPAVVIEECTERGILVASAKTCTAPQRFTADEARFCDKNPNEPVCQESSRIKSETYEVELNPTKKLGKQLLGIKVGPTVGGKHEYVYEPDKISFQDSARQNQTDIGVNEGASLESNIYRQAESMVYVGFEIGYDGKKNNNDIEVNIIDAKAYIPIYSETTTPQSGSAQLQEIESRSNRYRQRFDLLQQNNLTEAEEERRREEWKAQQAQARAFAGMQRAQHVQQMQSFNETLFQAIHSLSNAMIQHKSYNSPTTNTLTRPNCDGHVPGCGKKEHIGCPGGI